MLPFESDLKHSHGYESNFVRWHRHYTTFLATEVYLKLLASIRLILPQTLEVHPLISYT